MQQIRAVLFDLDNTLFDRDEAFIQWAKAFLTNTVKLPPGAEREETLKLIVALDSGGEGDKLSWFEAVRAKHPSIAQTAADLLANFFEHRVDYMELDAGARPLFDTLRAHGIPWGIVTNGKSEQWDKVRKMGLDKATDCLFVSSDFGHYKPDVRIFMAAAAKLGVEAQHILFVGDHPVNDIKGARDAGMQTAWLSRHRIWADVSSEPPPDYTLSGIGEVAKLVVV